MGTCDPFGPPGRQTMVGRAVHAHAAHSMPTGPRVLAPNDWSGQADCRVGPFRDPVSAQRFSNALVDFGRFETLRERVVVDADGVYVEVTRLRG